MNILVKALSPAFLLLITILYGCVGKEKKNIPVQLPTEHSEAQIDKHSYSNTNEIYTQHLHLELDINFEKQLNLWCCEASNDK